MDPHVLGRKYDRIAAWWEEELRDSEYGLAQIRRAISYAPKGTALDVGCGAGGRVIRELESAGYTVVGLDVSAEMLTMARRSHPEVAFHHASITEWTTDATFELIVAWDSIFHLPIADQEPVVRKLCGLLAPRGILAYTFGDAVGEHESEWRGDTFHYSSIGIEGNLRVIREAGCEVRHLELDQHPEHHVCVIARRPDAP
jgi:SAM-dependent methyltransferase